MLHNRLKSRNVHSEIVFSLSPNNNIAESFRRFGILDTTSMLLAIKVLDTSSAARFGILDPSAHLASSVEGVRIDFNDASLKRTADLPRVRKIYKLDSVSNSVGGSNKKSKGARGSISTENQVNGAHDEIDSMKEMEAVILGIMALKGS